jgi:hypothetical protein
LSLDDARQALAVFARQPNLAALVVAGYNPTRDSDGRAVKIVIDLLVTALSPRLQAPPGETTEITAAGAAPQAETTAQTSENVETPVEPISAAVSTPSELPDLAKSSSDLAPEKPSDAVPEAEPPAE